MDVDAVLLLSFGGPEGPEQVRPFLENVTRGRNIPPERLDDVAEHYLHFGGVSPINGINRALIEAVAGRTRTRGADTPGLLRQPQLGAVRRRRRYPDARRRHSPGSGVHHVCLGRLFELHAVRRGHRPWPRGGRRARTRAGQAAPVLRPPAASSRCSPTGSPPRRRRCPTSSAPTPGWCSPRIRCRSPPTSATDRSCTAGRWPTRRGWSRRPPGTTTTTRCGSRGPDPPRIPWLEPDVGDHLSALADGGYPRGDRLPDRLRRRPHRGGVGPRQRTARSRPRKPGWRSPGRPRPMPTRASRGWPPTSSTNSASAPTPVAARRAGPVPGCGFASNGQPCASPHCVIAVHRSRTAAKRRTGVTTAARPSAGSR